MRHPPAPFLVLPDNFLFSALQQAIHESRGVPFGISRRTSSRIIWRTVEGRALHATPPNAFDCRTGTNGATGERRMIDKPRSLLAGAQAAPMTRPSRAAST